MAIQDSERRYSFYEVRTARLIPDGTHVAHYQASTPSSTSPVKRGWEYGVQTGILGHTTDSIGTHVTLNGRKIAPNHHADYFVITDERINEVRP